MKDGVHACVLRIFFFELHNCASKLEDLDVYQTSGVKGSGATPLVCFMFFCGSFVRE